MYMYVNEGIRVQMISQEAMEWELSRAEYDRKIMQLQQQLNDANATRTACDKVYIYMYMSIIIYPHTLYMCMCMQYVSNTH